METNISRRTALINTLLVGGALGAASLSSGTRAQTTTSDPHKPATPEMYNVDYNNANLAFQSAADSVSPIIQATGVFRFNAPVIIPDNKIIDLRGAKIKYDDFFVGDAVFICGNNVTFLCGEIEGYSYRFLGDKKEIAILCKGLSDTQRKIAPTIIGTKFLHIGHTAIELVYTKGGFAKDVEIRECGYAGIMGISCIDFHVTNFFLDSLYGESSVEHNAYGIAFTNLVGNMRSSGCSVNEFLIKNVTTWHGIDTHGGKNISFKNGKIVNCKRGAILTCSDLPPEHCEIVDVEVINDIVDCTDVTILGATIVGEAFWVIGTPSLLAKNNILKNLVAKGHGTYNDYLGSFHLLNTERTNIRNCDVLDGTQAGITMDGINKDLNIDGFTVNKLRKNNPSRNNASFGIHVYNGSNVSGVMRNIQTQGVEVGIYAPPSSAITTSPPSIVILVQSFVRGTVTNTTLNTTWSSSALGNI